MLGLLSNFAAACQSGFFGFPHWYEYLNVGTKRVAGKNIPCQILSFNVPSDLILVALAIIDMLIHVAGLVAVIFVIVGGIQYVTSQGNPDATAKAQSTIINALIGLALVLIAIALVSFLGGKLGS